MLRGDEDAARDLLDQASLAIKNDNSAFVTPASVAIQVLNGDNQADLQQIREPIPPMPWGSIKGGAR